MKGPPTVWIQTGPSDLRKLLGDNIPAPWSIPNKKQNILKPQNLLLMNIEYPSQNFYNIVFYKRKLYME
jgi:hypothetical protein